MCVPGSCINWFIPICILKLKLKYLKCKNYIFFTFEVIYILFNMSQRTFIYLVWYLFEFIWNWTIYVMCFIWIYWWNYISDSIFYLKSIYFMFIVWIYSAFQKVSLRIIRCNIWIRGYWVHFDDVTSSVSCGRSYSIHTLQWDALPFCCTIWYNQT